MVVLCLPRVELCLVGARRALCGQPQVREARHIIGGHDGRSASRVVFVLRSWNSMDFFDRYDSPII